MTPVFCRVKHDPENGTYGDCLRASVASLFDIERPEDIPNFADGGVSGNVMFDRLKAWALTKGVAPFCVGIDGNVKLNDLLEIVEFSNPGLSYLLFGRTSENGHVVIAGRGRVLHDSAWVKSSLVGPSENGHWLIVVFVSALHLLK